MTECNGCGLLIEDMTAHARERHHVEPEALDPALRMPDGFQQDKRDSGLIVIHESPGGGYL